MSISDRIESILSWYSAEGRVKVLYIMTRWLAPFIILTLFLSLATAVYRPFAWVTAVSCLVGFIAFLGGVLVAMAGVLDMNMRGGPADSVCWNIGAVFVAVAACLSLWALPCFASMIISFTVLGLDVPAGW